jgi:hypothetical protein
MPRKSTKSAPEGENIAQQGVDTLQALHIAQILDEAASKGKPEGLPAKGEEKKKTGRPSTYNPETAEKMCELLSEGVPLREICRMEGMPYWRAVYRWMAQDEALSAHIARARDVGYDAMAEECLDIADNADNDWVERSGDKGVGWTLNGEHIQRSKLRIETRLKLLAKWNPKKYGDRQILAGDSEAPLEVQNDAMTILAAAVKNLELRRQTANEE